MAGNGQRRNPVGRRFGVGISDRDQTRDMSCDGNSRMLNRPTKEIVRSWSLPPSSSQSAASFSRPSLLPSMMRCWQPVLALCEHVRQLFPPSCRAAEVGQMRWRTPLINFSNTALDSWPGRLTLTSVHVSLLTSLRWSVVCPDRMFAGPLRHRGWIVARYVVGSPGIKLLLIPL